MSGESDSPAPAPQGESISPAGLPGPGFRVGEYTLVQELGRGAMATVFRAVDATGHEVAIKLFQEGPSVSPTLLERFRREVETAKKLRRHPHIMKVYATGRQGPLHFLVMELIPGGRTLEDVDASGPDGIDRIVSLGAKVARALHFAHQQGVIHRDVKPTNVMINEFDEPLLTDFGVAALVDLPALTLTGTLMGTPLYMSPEQSGSSRAAC